MRLYIQLFLIAGTSSGCPRKICFGWVPANTCMLNCDAHPSLPALHMYKETCKGATGFRKGVLSTTCAHKKGSAASAPCSIQCSFTFQFMPVTPTPLLPVAPTVPAQCVPCPCRHLAVLMVDHAANGWCNKAAHVGIAF